MIKKIYNLIFSQEEFRYQLEAYDVLNFWESYRGWLIIIFITSFIFSIWFFAVDLWVLQFLIPFYALICFFIYEGRIWAMLLLTVLYILEKINNFNYLLLEPWKLLLFIFFTIIFLVLLYRSLKLEFIKGKKEKIIKHKKVWKGILALIVLIIVWQVIVTVNAYSPFIKERLAFDIQQIDNQTKINNSNFKIEFTVDDNCYLASDTANYLWADYSWSGNLWCDNHADYVIFLVDDYIGDLDTFSKINDYLYTNTDNNYWDIAILDENKEKKLLIGGYAYTQDIQNDILQSFKKL